MDIASKHHGTLKAKPKAAKIYFFNTGFYEGILYRIGQEAGPNLVNMNPGVRGQEHMQAPSDSLRPIVREIDGRPCLECEIRNPELPIFRTSLGSRTVGVLEVVPYIALVLGDEKLEVDCPLNFLRAAATKTKNVLNDFCKLIE